MKKAIVILITLFLTSCASNGSSNPSKIETGLKGKFVNEVELKAIHRDFVGRDEGNFLYTSTYPLNNMSGFGCDSLSGPQVIGGVTYYQYHQHEAGQEFRYYYSQTLTLQKDQTYRYQFEIIFGNPWNCPDMMSINADIYGTYIQSKTSDNEYIISLSSPLSGTETIYACHFSVDELWWFGGGITAKHSTPDKVVDFALNREIEREEIDWYVRNRDVRITLATTENPSNTIYDDLFNCYFLDDVGQYCTY